MNHKALILPLALVAALGLFSGAAQATKGGNRNGQSLSASSIILIESDPHLGGTATFITTFPQGTRNPRIDLQCHDYSGELVYGEAGSFDHQFVLGGGSSIWKTNGGLAHCSARLFDLIWNGNNPQEVVLLAVTDFDAAG